MRRILLTGTAAVALLCLSAPRRPLDAYVLPVACITCPTWAQHAVSWYQQAADMARQIGQGAQVISNGVQQLNQARAAYHAITNIHDLGSLVGAMGVVGIRNPLPINAYALQAALSGQGGFQGTVGSLSGIYAGGMAMNTVYQTPNVLNWAAMQVNQSMAAATGAQAAVLSINQEIQQREAHVANLRAQIGRASTPALQNGIMSQIQAEQLEIARLRAQLSTVGTFAQQQQVVFRAQAQQQGLRSMEETLNTVLSQIGMGGS